MNENITTTTKWERFRDSLGKLLAQLRPGNYVFNYKDTQFLSADALCLKFIIAMYHYHIPGNAFVFGDNVLVVIDDPTL